MMEQRSTYFTCDTPTCVIGWSPSPAPLTWHEALSVEWQLHQAGQMQMYKQVIEVQSTGFAQPNLVHQVAAVQPV